MAQHKKPCKECPFRKAAFPGFLGASTPEEFCDTAMSESRMPCHMTVNYDRPGWEAAVMVAPQCAGRAIFHANQCKLPKNPHLLRLEPDESVLAFPKDFLAHHTQPIEKFIAARKAEKADK